MSIVHRNNLLPSGTTRFPNFAIVKEKTLVRLTEILYICRRKQQNNHQKNNQQHEKEL